MTEVDVMQEVDSEQLHAILEEILSSLGLESFEVFDDVTVGTTSSVTIGGAWNGAVLVELPESVDRRLAGAMFMMEPDDLGDDELVDAIGELANMVGGGVKGMLPEPSRLSLPTVVSGSGLRIVVPGSSRIAQIGRACEVGQVFISVWYSATG